MRATVRTDSNAVQTRKSVHSNSALDVFTAFPSRAEMSLSSNTFQDAASQQARNGNGGGRPNADDGAAGAQSERSQRAALMRLRAKSAQRAAARALIADAGERALQYTLDQDAAMDEYLRICAATLPPPSDRARRVEEQLLAGATRASLPNSSECLRK